MKRPTNHFNIGVRMRAIAFGIKNRTDVEITPEVVARECEEFAARIRQELAKESNGDKK